MNTSIKSYPTTTTTDPCPTCGAEARITHGYHDRKGNPIHLTKCPNCGENLQTVTECASCAAVRGDA